MPALFRGKPLFHDLMRRRSPQHFYAFDLLWLNGRDLRELPLIERRRLVRTLVCSPVLYADHIEARGLDLFEAACSQDLEGIEAKLASGRYEPGATTWVKIKNRSYSQADGREEFFDERAPKLAVADLTGGSGCSRFLRLPWRRVQHLPSVLHRRGGCDAHGHSVGIVAL